MVNPNLPQLLIFTDETGNLRVQTNINLPALQLGLLTLATSLISGQILQAGREQKIGIIPASVADIPPVN